MFENTMTYRLVRIDSNNKVWLLEDVTIFELTDKEIIDPICIGEFVEDEDNMKIKSSFKEFHQIENFNNKWWER